MEKTHGGGMLALGWAFLMCGACGANDPAAGGDAQEEGRVGIAPPSFTVPLHGESTAENVTAQILAAGRVQLAALCEAQPGNSVRIFHPFASGAYTDLACVSVLEADSASGEARAALVDAEPDGPIAVARQKWSPIGLGCSLIMLGVGALAAEGCRQNYRSSVGCPWAATGGTFLINIAMCQFL